MNATDQFLATQAQVDPAAIAPLPNSRKVYVQGERPDVRVPMREISQADTPAGFGGEPNPPIFVYDCAGAYTDPAHRIANRPLDGLLVQVMTKDAAGTRVGRAIDRREHELPAPLGSRIGILARQGMRQIGPAITFPQILLVQGPHPLQMQLQGRRQLAWQHGHPILLALAIANQDFQSSKLHILDPQTQHFHQAHARAIQQAGDQPQRRASAQKGESFQAHLAGRLASAPR